MEWIFRHAEVFKNFISKKDRLYKENGETRNGDTRKAQIVLAIN